MDFSASRRINMTDCFLRQPLNPGRTGIVLSGLVIIVLCYDHQVMESYLRFVPPNTGGKSIGALPCFNELEVISI